MKNSQEFKARPHTAKNLNRFRKTRNESEITKSASPLPVVDHLSGETAKKDQQLKLNDTLEAGNMSIIPGTQEHEHEGSQTSYAKANSDGREMGSTGRLMAVENQEHVMLISLEEEKRRAKKIIDHSRSRTFGGPFKKDFNEDMKHIQTNLVSNDNSVPSTGRSSLHTKTSP